MRTRADFDYGNARLRARKGTLLGGQLYERLLGSDVEGMLGLLAETPYGPDLRASAGRLSGLPALRDAVRRHLARSLEELRSFYGGSARTLVDVLLSRWDLHNLLTLVRGRAAEAPADAIVANVVPIGALAPEAAKEVADQSDADRAVNLLVSWRLPAPHLSRALARAWPHYVRTEDLAGLEGSLARAHFARAAAAAAELGETAKPLADDIEREADLRNALTALRVRSAREGGQDEHGDAQPPQFVPGGSARSEELDAALGASGSAEAAELLAGAVRDPHLREALARWSPDHGLVALGRLLEERRTRAALALFRQGDPLGAAIPVAFAAAKEAEARNVRLIAQGAAEGEDPEELRSELLLGEELA